MKDHIEKCGNAAAQRFESLLAEEKEPFTMNEHYFMEYRSKFLVHYKKARQRDKSQFIRNIENKADGNMVATMNNAITYLTRMGLEGADSAGLANLLPSDSMDPAIEIMADVRAYFQGS